MTGKLPKASGPVEQVRWEVPLRHPTLRIANDKCPACGFPECEGGFCDNCGWTAFDPSCPHCRKEQGR